MFARPEPQSFSGSLREEGVRALLASGHACQVSDLYAMKWKATVDRDDFTDEHVEQCVPDERLIVTSASKNAYNVGTLSADIRAEQDKLDWVDTVVWQLPLWWYGRPAIVKGWFDRVFVKGHAYGVTDPANPSRTLRYGEGKLAGERAAPGRDIRRRPDQPARASGSHGTAPRPPDLNRGHRSSAVRYQNGGDYDDLVLRPDQDPGTTGLGVHYTR